MDTEKLNEIMRLVSRGDTSRIEVLFNKPGGRKFLESIVLVVVCHLPYTEEEKEELFTAFRKALNKIEKRIKHQHQGQKILQQVYE